MYFVDERFGYGTIEEYSRSKTRREGLLHGRLYRTYLKRPIDVLGSLLGLAVLSPVFLIIAILIRADSPGPILFRQIRIGKDGRSFWFYKFRSMVENAEEMKHKLMHLNELEGPVFKISEDPRITPIGRFLRKTSLDELPQLLNVLYGQMSLVGPRPPLPSEVEKYEGWQRDKLTVLPGITCLWQISGRNHIGFTEWMRLDIEYIRRQSLGLGATRIQAPIHAGHADLNAPLSGVAFGVPALSQRVSAQPAAIQPRVPPTRTLPKSDSGLRRCRKHRAVTGLWAAPYKSAQMSRVRSSPVRLD